MFITFEGLDGSGKTTTLKKVKELLTSLKLDFILTREPGGSNTPEEKQIRKLLLHNLSQIDSMTELLLYSSARRINLETVIFPALKANKIVLCDRYVDSTFAYQGFGRNLGFARVKTLQDLITDNTYPDLTIFFDLPPEKSSKRAQERSSSDRIEQADDNFKQRVYDGYITLGKLFPDRFVIVDASQSKEAVFNQVKNIILKKIMD